MKQDLRKCSKTVSFNNDEVLFLPNVYFELHSGSVPFALLFVLITAASHNTNSLSLDYTSLLILMKK